MKPWEADHVVPGEGEEEEEEEVGELDLTDRVCGAARPSEPTAVEAGCSA